MYKYRFQIENSQVATSKTKLNHAERVDRIPIELATFLNDPKAKINLDKEGMKVTIESSLLSEKEIIIAVEKCFKGLNFVCPQIQRSTF